MPHIHIFLQELDHLYHAGDIDQYEQYWQQACQHAERFFPGFTIAYAELSNSGSDRLADGAMRHVLVPQPQMYTKDACQWQYLCTPNLNTPDTNALSGMPKL